MSILTVIIILFKGLLKWLGKGKFPRNRKVGRIVGDHSQGWDRSIDLLKYDY
jgi:hypothetical protein